ncbi:IQ and AAA domain-containing protein 1-like [Chelonus insularis]|uniref:IQ and AAA domain-containing protein 1-like n=1 Tax=Chelonus insularis TaxID=460826 RepID=UPI001588C583|nr:IQ and AAA domain-containing protein 1-like [Chelonus insularis]
MANEFFNQIWLSAQSDIEDLQLTDIYLQENQNPLNKDIALKQILPVYLRYRNIVNRLILCCDRIVQSQKRELVKRLLNCCIGRMLEYKREIVKLNCSEYEWPDDLLIKMKWTPDDVGVSSPSSYISDRNDQLKERRNFIDSLIKLTEDSELAEKVESNNSNLQNNLILTNLKVTQSQIENLDETFEEKFKRAILTIQNHERARIARKIAIQIEMENEYRRKLRTGEIEFKDVKKETMRRAAITIQRYWRGYLARKKLKNHLNKVEELLDMSIPSKKDDSIFLEDNKNLQIISVLQSKALDQLQKEINREESQITKNKRLSIIEDTIDEIREWLAFWYNEVGYFGIYPSSKEGGSVLITTENVLTPQEFVAQLSEKNQEDKRNLGDKKKSKEQKKKNIDTWVMPKSKVLEVLFQVNQEFNDNWRNQVNTHAFNREINIDLVKQQIYFKLHKEVRTIVDDLMILELKKLNAALKKDHKKDKEKFEIPGMKKVASTDELNKILTELVFSKIIKNYKEVKLNQWIGDTSFKSHEIKSDNKNYQYQLGDIKQAILDYCVLPLGSKDVHSIAPLVRSICIVGQPFSGKKFLAHAICSEVGALLFDLTPATLADKYEGKANEAKLMKMIKTLAKAYPPAVILIDGGDKPWWKKIPPEEKSTQPKRFAQWLKKFIKSIKPGDQILVVGLASEPWKSKKTFYKIYDKFIIIPLSDYNSLHLFYNKLLMKYHGIDRNIDISSLARATIGYPLGLIHEAVENVLNINRRMTLKFQPLRGEEILTELMKWESPSQKDIKLFQKFENKTPLGKKRIKMLKQSS